MNRKNYVPTIVLSEGRTAGPYDGLVAQQREEKRQAVIEARRKGREALAKEREAEMRFGRAWSPFG